MRKQIENYLRLSEKYTKMDMVYFVESGAWVTLGQVVSSGMTFLLALAFANLLPKEIYGQYKYVLGLAGLLGAITLTGLETSVVQAVARGFEGVLRKAFWENIKWSAGFSAAAFGMSGYYYFFEKDFLLAASLLFIGVLVPFTRSAQLYTSFLNGKKEFGTKTAYEACSTVTTGIILFAVIAASGNALVLVGAYFVTQFCLALFLYFKTAKGYRPGSESDPEFSGYAKHLSILNFLDIIASNIDKVLVFNFVGPAALATYSFAIGIPEQVKPFLKGLTNIILPRFSERSEAEIRKNLGNKIGKLFIFNAVIAGAYILAAPLVYRLFFPQYRDSILYSQIFAVSMLAGSITPIEIFLLAKRKIKEQYVIRILTSVFQIVSVLALTFLFGLMGLIFARISTRFFAAALNVCVYAYMPKGIS